MSFKIRDNVSSSAKYNAGYLSGTSLDPTIQDQLNPFSHPGVDLDGSFLIWDADNQIWTITSGGLTGATGPPGVSSGLVYYFVWRAIIT